VKPFFKQHPVRANFGDPRTIFPLSLFQNGIEGPGLFLFHNGIDIAAPDGTSVYPVVSGTAVLIDAETVAVQTPEGRTFQYVHIVPLVNDGDHVVAQKTPLGYIKHPAGHVHLTEIRGFKVWNPLARGGIAPYRDTTTPTVAGVIFRRWNTLQELDPLGICAEISIVSEAFDTPPLQIPGSFAEFPISPALLTWSVRRVGTGHMIVPPTTAVDFRGTLPLPPDFWNVYARGTYQNAPRFGPRQYDLMPGRFLYNLTPLDGLDTRTLPNGVYQVTVRAADIRGNAQTLNRRFTIVNQPGSETGCPKPSPPAPKAP
jgi:murein DD-endopeptidase MepM/ murein hydrolase activator NlpD